MFFAPTTLSTLRRLTPLALVAGLALVSGCTCSGPPASGFGDFSFDWSFDGERSCAAAGVDTLVYTLEDVSGGVTEQEINCVGGGVSIRDIEAGSYVLFVDGIRGNQRVYESAAINFSIRSERNSELGEIELNGLGGGATLAGFWAFAFPTDDSSVKTCEIAGVETVDVQVFEAGTNILVPDASFTFPCSESGFIIEPLPAGIYDVALLASGTYDGAIIDYYAAIVEGIELTTNFTLDLGDVTLFQIPESFGDFNLDITLPATCAELGSPDLTFEFIRLGATEADDINDGTLTVACAVVAAEQFIFVPADYFIIGTSSNNSVSGEVQTFIEPNAVTNVAFQFLDN